MIPIILFLVSFAIQLMAAVYALLLIRITGWKLAWIFISTAMVLMVSRRVVTFISFMVNGKAIRFDVPEIIALLVSCLMLLGVLNIRALFRALYAAEAERKVAEQEISKLNAELILKIRQLEAAQEELVRKEKLSLLGQVVGSVGHELRNPLGVMNNAVHYLQIVLDDANDNVKEYLDIIKSEIGGADRIVAELLDSVRTKPPQPEIIGVRELLEKTLVKCSAPSTVTVKLDIPATLSPLQVDPQQIHQVFRNLISNGIEAMPEGGALDIRAQENKPDGTVIIRVHDSGSGMTPEHLAKLFQPLFTTKARGIGLGLVVVKNLIQANGGTVQVESEAGKGTTFTVTLPGADSHAKPGAAV